MPDKLIDPTSVSHMFRLSENHGCVSTGVISTCCLTAHLILAWCCFWIFHFALVFCGLVCQSLCGLA